MPRRFWVETLGCPKNQVDSDKLTGTLLADGLVPAAAPEVADVVVVNTCAFIEDARQESIDTILALADQRSPGAELVVTGCLAERHGAELADALPEVDRIAPFGARLTAGGSAGTAVVLGPTRNLPVGVRDFDLLELPRPAHPVPWAYVKVAEGCDRTCGFCAIPTFRGKQRSRSGDSLLAEVEALAAGGVREVVLVAQDLASYGRDLGERGAIVPLIHEVTARVDRVRLLYLYPSELTDRLVAAILATGVAYFDLSLQHASKPLLRAMRRWGDGERFLERIGAIRQAAPEAAFRSSFIVGYPGETDVDHERMVEFLHTAQLDWAGFFPFSREDGTHAAALAGTVPPDLVAERLNELSEIQDGITARRRDDLVGSEVEVLVDRPGIGRSHREAPEIDGVITVPPSLPSGSLTRVEITGAIGTDLTAEVTAEVTAEPVAVGATAEVTA
jgi:ribosomal protein S12 methylthiotransferase RimO